MKKETIDTFWQFVKFNIVGVLNTAVGFGVYFLLTELAGMNFVLAQTISYAAGIVNSYVWNTLWTFKKEQRRSAREMMLFVAVNLVSYAVSVGVLALFKDVLHVPYELVNKAAASLSSAVVNFAGNKLFVFNREKTGIAETPADGNGAETEKAPEGEDPESR